MAFEIPPRGPLAILKNSMTGLQTGHIPVKKSVQEYCKELKNNLEIAQEIATTLSAIKQQRYVDYYNRHAKDKSFNVGDPVIV